MVKINFRVNVESNQGKSKPYPSELAQTERRNIKKRLADTSKAVTELERLSNTKLAKALQITDSEIFVNDACRNIFHEQKLFSRFHNFCLFKYW